MWGHLLKSNATFLVAAAGRSFWRPRSSACQSEDVASGRTLRPSHTSSATSALANSSASTTTCLTSCARNHQA